MIDPANEAIDIAHLTTWIGREETVADQLTADLLAKYRATFNMPAGDLTVGSIAPRLIHFCLTPAIVAGTGLGPDGHPRRGGFLPPVPLPRRMWAGSTLRFDGDLRVGDEVRRTSRIADVAVKTGRSGQLCFVKVDHTLSVGGTLRVRETQDIVYRGLDAGGAASGKESAPAEAAPTGDVRERITPDPVLLFRYSALTFNGHRIHYDRRYVMEEEGYPGLVVHGPMQAAFLLNLATAIAGKSPAAFQFRSLSPLFDTEDVVLNARWDEEKLRLWTARAIGPLATQAVAEFA
jgi:3-methylfumaryl-CoA hydratase